MNTLIILTYILAISFFILAIEYNKLREVNKKLTEQLENPQVKTKPKSKSIHKNIKSTVYPYDENYDRLIKKIVTTGKVIDITEHHLIFSVCENIFKIWITNKDGCYGSHLKGSGGLDIDGRSISKETVELLYAQELLYSTNNPKPSKKEIEDEIILELLGGDDES